MEDMGGVPEGAPIAQRDPRLSEDVTNYEEPIAEINLWLLGKRVSADGTHIEDNPNVEPIMTPEGAKAYCSWLRSITAKPITFSNQKHNTVARRLILNCLTCREMLMTNAEDWKLDFDKYANLLGEIQDTLGTAAASGSIGGFTLQKLTENLNINESRERSSGKRSWWRSIFSRGGATNE